MSKRFLLAACVLFATACSQHPQVRSTVPGLTDLPLPVADGAAAACWFPDSSTVALAGDELQLIDSLTSRRLWKTPFDATYLSCSPDSDRLLAARPGQDRSVLLDCRRTAGSCRQGTLPGRLLQVAWSRDGEPLLVTLRYEPLSFGENLSYLLFDWDGAMPTERRRLYDVTIRKGRYRQLQQQLTAAMFYVAGFGGDLLVLPVPHDPPAVAGYFDLQAFYLPRAESWSLLHIPLSEAVLSVDERQEFLQVNQADRSLLVDLWGEQPPQARPIMPVVTTSPDGQIRIEGTRWLNGDAAPLDLPAGTRVVFAPDGSRALLLTDSRVQLVALPNAASRAGANRRLPLATLRDWRAAGLINADEYRQLKGNP